MGWPGSFRLSCCCIFLFVTKAVFAEDPPKVIDQKQVQSPEPIAPVKEQQQPQAPEDASLFSEDQPKVFSTEHGSKSAPNSDAEDTGSIEDELTLLSMTFQEILDSKIVAATKREQNVSDTPATAYVITEDQIRIRGYTNLDQVLADIPGIEIQHKSVAEYQNYYTIRGIAENDKFIIMLDGFKISPADNTPNVVGSNYPLIDVERVEVVLGPASALYGPDAVTGIINIITKGGKDIHGVNFRTSYGQYNTTHNSLSLGTEIGGISVRLAGHFYYSAEPFQPDAYPGEFAWYNESYKTEGAMRLLPTVPIKISGLPVADYATPTLSYSLHARVNYREFELGYFLTQESHNDSAFGRPEFNVYSEDATYKTTTDMAYAKHVYTSLSGALALTSSLWYGGFELDPDSAFLNTFTGYAPGYKYGFGRSVKLEEQLSYNFSRRYSFIGGISGAHSDSLPKTSDLPRKYNKDEPADWQGIPYPGTKILDRDGNSLEELIKFYNLEYIDAGGFLQFQAAPIDLLELTAGMRLDYNTRYGTSFNPRVGVLVKPLSNLKIKLLFGMAYLAPSPYQAYQHYGSFSGADASGALTTDPTQIVGLVGPFWHIPPEKELEPERLKSVEGTVIYQPLPSLAATLNGYYQRLDDMISFEYTQNVPFPGLEHINILTAMRPVNSGTGQYFGGSLRLDGYLAAGKLSVNPNLSYAYSNGDIDGLLLPYNARHTVKGGVDLAYLVRSLSRASLSARLLYRSRSYHQFVKNNLALPPGDYGKDIKMAPYDLTAFGEPAMAEEALYSEGYFLLNLHLRYENALASEKLNLSFFLDIQNATNQGYYNVALASSEGFFATPQDHIRVVGGLDFHY